MKSKKIVENTTNRGDYNRAYKSYLTHRKNGIHCSYCKYHSNENYDGKWYGGFIRNEVRFPNWKLVSKNRKQWMEKSLVLEEVIKHNEFSHFKVKF
jgi:hypothetical protein